MFKYLLIFMPLLLWGEMISYPAVWNVRNCKVTADTPFGRVYHFPYSEKWTILLPATSVRKSGLHRDNCDCRTCSYRKQTVDGGVLEVEIPKKLKADKKRFLSISFKIRAFPASSSKKRSDFSILFYDSQRNISGSSYSRLHGLSVIHSNTFDFNYTSANNRLLEAYRLQLPCRPAFQPIAVRIIYDMQKGSMKLCINHDSTKFIRIEERIRKPMKLSHFAISTSYWKTGKKDSVSEDRNDYLEISNPVFHFCNTEKELSTLPTVKFSPYPYHSYKFTSSGKRSLSETVFYRKLLHHNNPDLQYAYALRYLYASAKECDPEKALQLLEKAAGKKHVLALYELGLCYFRGYGVTPDLKEAKKYLQKASQYQYPNADALLWLIDFTASGRAWFSTNKLWQQAAAIPAGNIPEHDTAFVQNSFSPMISPKLIKIPQISEKYEKPSGPGEKYLDWLAKNNYAPAFFYLVLQDENHKRSPKECVQLLQKAYKGNPLFYPELLYYEFRKNKILQSGAFTPQKTLLYRDDPLYTLLSFYRKNPDFPRLKESLLASQRCPEFAEWKKIKSPEADLVRGLSIMVQEQYKRIHSSSSVKLQEAFSCLERAALKKNPVALYWIGRAYYYNDLPPALQKQNTNHESRVWKARIFLQEAEKSGNQNASLLLAEIELNQPTTKLIRILSITDAFCKLKLPLAFELKTQVLRRLGRNAEANRISREGIEAGSYRLYRDLALSEKQKKKSATANQYWFKFIQGDRISRMEDIEDFFWSDPYREFSQGHDDQKNNIRYNQKNQIREP